MACMVYMTAENPEQAKNIAQTLVGERMAACVNIIPGMKSFYWWEGKVAEGQETVVIAKTTQAHVSRLTERVKALHSYSCPCVVALPVEGGNADFLAWIEAETA